MRIYVTSDWHLDAVTAGVERFKDVLGKVADLAERVVESDADAFVFCGDLANPDNPSRLLRALRVGVGVAASLKMMEIPSLWLTGNHDVVEDGLGTSTLTPIKDVAKVADQPMTGTWHLGDENRLLTWMALPYTPASHPYDPEAFVERCDEDVELVFSHLNVRGIGPGSETKDFLRGREVFLPHRLIQRKWPRCRIIQGHYHRPQEFEGVTVVGALERFTRADVDEPRGWLVVR